MREALLIDWMVKEGEFIDVDQPFCQFMTKWATVEINTPRASVIGSFMGAVFVLGIVGAIVYLYLWLTQNLCCTGEQ